MSLMDKHTGTPILIEAEVTAVTLALAYAVVSALPLGINSILALPPQHRFLRPLTSDLSAISSTNPYP